MRVQENNIDSTTEGFEGEIAYLSYRYFKTRFNFLEFRQLSLQTDPLLVILLNIHWSNFAPIPSPLDWEILQILLPGTNGLMQVGFTDPGPLVYQV